MSTVTPRNVSRIYHRVVPTPDGITNDGSPPDSVDEHRPCFSFGSDRQQKWGGLYFFCSNCVDLENKYSGYSHDYEPFITSSKIVKKYICRARHLKTSDIPTHLNKRIPLKRHKLYPDLYYEKKRKADDGESLLPTKRQSLPHCSNDLNESESVSESCVASIESPANSEILINLSPSIGHSDDSANGTCYLLTCFFIVVLSRSTCILSR